MIDIFKFFTYLKFPQEKANKISSLKKRAFTNVQKIGNKNQSFGQTIR